MSNSDCPTLTINGISYPGTFISNIWPLTCGYNIEEVPLKNPCPKGWESISGFINQSDKYPFFCQNSTLYPQFNGTSSFKTVPQNVPQNDNVFWILIIILVILIIVLIYNYYKYNLII